MGLCEVAENFHMAIFWRCKTYTYKLAIKEIYNSLK